MSRTGRGLSLQSRRYVGSVRVDVMERLDPSKVLVWPASHAGGGGESDLLELLEPTPRVNGVPSVSVMLQGLTGVERKVVRLHVLQGLSFQACGEELGMTRQGACRACHRALEKLRSDPRLRRFADG